MLCSGAVCISLSLVCSFVLSTFLRTRNPAEFVVTPEDRQELQKDVEAAEVLAVVAAVLCITYLWRRLFKKPAPEPEPLPSLEGLKEEKQHEEGLLRRPSENKETQYELYEEVQYVTVETQTSDSLLPVEWTSSESQFSESSLSMKSPPLDTQMHTSELGTNQQATADVETNCTAPNYPETSTAQEEILPKETTLDSMVQEVLELQVSRGPQKSEENQQSGTVSPPVGTPRSETTEKTRSPRAADPQLHAATAKPHHPTGAGDFEPPPHSAGDASSPEAESGLRVIHNPPVHSPRKPVTFTVSLEGEQSPRRSVSTPCSPGRTSSCLPVPKAGFRRRVCNHCRTRDECQRAADGSRPTTATALVAPTSTSPRGSGDAQVCGAASRLPAAGRGCRLHPPSAIRGRPPPGHAYSDIHFRQGPPCARPYACRPPSYGESNQ